MSINKRRTVRIISGTRKGSKLQFPDVAGLRPSGDRIRETLLAWLQSSVAESSCLDMFAGSGAIGFEAASRGAARVVMIEKNRFASEAIKKNADRLAFDNVEVITADALSETVYKNQLNQQQFNLVFIDPPFSENLHARAIECVLRCEILTREAWVYIEAGKRTEATPVPADWELHREKVAGDVRMQLYRVIAGG